MLFVNIFLLNIFEVIICTVSVFWYKYKSFPEEILEKFDAKTNFECEDISRKSYGNFEKIFHENN